MMTDSHALSAPNGLISRIQKRILIKLFDAALVAGSMQKSWFQSLGFPAERMLVGYDVVDNDYFAKPPSKEEENRVVNKFCLPNRYILSLGRFVAKKNLKRVIDAFALAANSGAGGCCLVLVGSGPEGAMLRARCSELDLPFHDFEDPNGINRNIQAMVWFCGFQQSDVNRVFYHRAKAFILGSTTEEWGLVINEAMASGLPLIVSNRVGCLQDLVAHQTNGLIVDPYDVSSIAEAISYLGINDEICKSLGQKSLEIIADWGLSRFSSAVRKTAIIAYEA